MEPHNRVNTAVTEDTAQAVWLTANSKLWNTVLNEVLAFRVQAISARTCAGKRVSGKPAERLRDHHHLPSGKQKVPEALCCQRRRAPSTMPLLPHTHNDSATLVGGQRGRHGTPDVGPGSRHTQGNPGTHFLLS